MLRAFALGVAVLLIALSGAPAAAVTTAEVVLTSQGPSPRVLTVQPGQSVSFVNRDPGFAYRAVSTSGDWTLDSGPQALLPGGRYAVPAGLLSRPGTYGYRVFDDPTFTGQIVVVRAGEPGAGQPGVGQPGVGQPGTGPPGTGPLGTGPLGTGQLGTGQLGTGQPGTGQPGTGPLGTGQPGTGQPGTGRPTDQTSSGTASAAPVPAGTAAPAPPAAPVSAPAVPGPIPGQGGRERGLPVLLAAVLVLGAGSLLLRVLLAEVQSSTGAPAARRC